MTTKVSWGETHLHWGEDNTVTAIEHLPTGVALDGPWVIGPEDDREFLLDALGLKVDVNFVKDGAFWVRRDGH